MEIPLQRVVARRRRRPVADLGDAEIVRLVAEGSEAAFARARRSAATVDPRRGEPVAWLMTIVGPHASELLPLLTFAISRRVSLLRLQRMVHTYPTLAGALGAVADEFARRTLPRLPSEFASYARYRWASPSRRGRGSR